MQNRTKSADYDYIRDSLGEPALLEMIAEECVELAHAALKLARWDRNENPTPIDVHAAWENLTEEIADVQIAMEAQLGTLEKKLEVESIKREKLKRWVERLREQDAWGSA